MRQLYCQKCGTLVVEIRDGRTLNGALVEAYCSKCRSGNKTARDLFSFLKGMKKT